ncbi:MAG: lipopolysaccharide biosynthesis protein [Syntrophobacteraceae bacterium]
MTESPRRKIFDALSWSFLDSVVMRVVQLTTGIILARILFPEQFGLIGMLMIFIALARAMTESGFGAALIQKGRITNVEICSVFYFNIIVGLLIAGACCLAAPWIADFYNKPILTPLMRALSLIMVINAFCMIQDNLFSMEMNFRATAITSLIAGGLSGGVGIGLALAGWGVWSLVIQQISLSLFRAICLWLLSSWRPAPIFNVSALRGLIPFGSRLLLSGLLTEVFENVYFVVIGRLFPAADLGLFSRARTLQGMPQETLSLIVGRVAFPLFSAHQDDPATLKRGLQKTVMLVAMISFPLMVGLAATARPVVIVLLGQKWAGSIRYLQLFCAAGLTYPLYMMNLQLLKSTGRSDLYLRLEVVWRVLTIVNILITWRWGISAMILGIIVISAVPYFLSCYLIDDLIDYPMGEQLNNLLPYLGIAALMGVVVFCIGLLHLGSFLLALPAQILLGAAVYVFLCRVFRLAALMEACKEMRDRLTIFRTSRQVIR